MIGNIVDDEHNNTGDKNVDDDKGGDSNNNGNRDDGGDSDGVGDGSNCVKWLMAETLMQRATDWRMTTLPLYTHDGDITLTWLIINWDCLIIAWLLFIHVIAWCAWY